MLWRLLLRNAAVRRVAGGLATAVIAGFGWKLGADAYDVAKQRVTRPRSE